MRVVIVSYGVYLKKIISYLNDDLDVAKIVVMDRFFLGDYDFVLPNDKHVKVCAYAYLKEAVLSLHYDYIMIGVLPKSYEENVILKDVIEKYGVDRNKIFRLGGMFISNFHHANMIMKYISNDISKYKVFITGTARPWCATDLDYYSLPTVNAAYSSQNLYYDYLWAKYLLNFKENRFRYAVIGMERYSFHYDESLSKSEDFMVLSYYLTFKETQYYCVSSNEMEKIFNDDFLSLSKNITLPSDFNLNLFDNRLINRQMDISALINARNYAETWHDKTIYKNDNHPDIVNYYKNVFIKYIELCKKSSIIPIVIFFPTTKLYENFFSKEIRDECLTILREYKKVYEFIFLGGDFFNDFSMNDFYDCDHLNASGARKCSKKINEIIMKLENNEIYSSDIPNYLETII